jgi:hypothetical protein
VQNERVTEIGWLINVLSYTNALSEPFTADALTNWSQIAVIAQQVDSDIGTDDNAVATGSVLDTIGDFLDVASVILEEEAPELGIAAGALFLAADLADTEQGTSDTDPVQASVANYGAALAQRFEDAETSYERLKDIIVSDYGKLETVGTLGGCPPSAQNCPEQWQWTNQSEEDASTSLLLSTRRQLYQTFMRLKYVAWDFSRYPVTDASQLVCRFPNTPDRYTPFPAATPSGQITLRDDPANQNSRFVLGSSNQNLDGSYTTPAGSLTDSLFAAPAQGGLGLYAPYFFLDNFQKPALQCLS